MDEEKIKDVASAIAHLLHEKEAGEANTFFNSLALVAAGGIAQCPEPEETLARFCGSVAALVEEMLNIDVTIQ